MGDIGGRSFSDLFLVSSDRKRRYRFRTTRDRQTKTEEERKSSGPCLSHHRCRCHFKTKKTLRHSTPVFSQLTFLHNFALGLLQVTPSRSQSRIYSSLSVSSPFSCFFFSPFSRHPKFKLLAANSYGSFSFFEHLRIAV